MRDFVSYPTSGNERLHCTMKRTEDNPEVGGPCYTLYLEYLGGLVPILKGRRISKLRPEFVIMDPKTDGKTGGVYILNKFWPTVPKCHTGFCSSLAQIVYLSQMKSTVTTSSPPWLTAAIAQTLVTLSSMMIGLERNHQRSPEGASLPNFPGTACFF